MPQFQRRILVVEDDAFTGSLMTSALDSAGFATARASNAVEAKKLITDFDPDAVLVDIDLGDGPNGVDFVHMLRKAHPAVAPILLSKHPNAVSAGVKGSIPDGVAYLRKSLVHTADGLVGAINEALHGRASRLRQDQSAEAAETALTPSQREVLRMMAQGLSNTEIARRRNTSTSAVEQRISEVFRAYGLTASPNMVPRVEAVRRYIAENGMPERAD